MLYIAYVLSLSLYLQMMMLLSVPKPLPKTGHLEIYLVSNNCLDPWSPVCAFALKKSRMAFNHDR